MRIRLLIEYDGTDYAGWQIQKGQRTIQGEIEGALNTVLQNAMRITGAGRTDTGVHARGQVAHLDINKRIELNKLQRALNGILSKDIRIKGISTTSNEFHARYSAKGRKYLYQISRTPLALLRNFSWYLPYSLNLNSMDEAASYVIGKHDFRSFCRTISTVKHHTCTVEDAEWIEEGEIIKFSIQANRFIHGMVRALVGTLVDVGREKLQCSDFINILKSRNRIYAGQSAPAKGLILDKIYY
jgi:tRNA pseudouridine38-40 synthase